MKICQSFYFGLADILPGGTGSWELPGLIFGGPGGLSFLVEVPEIHGPCVLVSLCPSVPEMVGGRAKPLNGDM